MLLILVAVRESILKLVVDSHVGQDSMGSINTLFSLINKGIQRNAFDKSSDRFSQKPDMQVSENRNLLI